MAEMHHHKLSPTICDYEQLISIGYKYNQSEIMSNWFRTIKSEMRVIRAI